MSAYMQNFVKFIPLLKELVSRDIKIKYRRSMLGVLWTLLNPLFMMIVLSIVFSNLFKFDVENFPLYLLSGQVIFNFFSDATTSSMTSIIGSAPLIKKIYIPKYLFVVSKVFSCAINLMASFTALICVMLATRAELHWTILLAGIPLLFVIMFSLGTGLILGAIAVKFRDIVHLYSVFITALLYLTPVIYPMSILPDTIRKLVMLNPITNFLMMFRDVIMYNSLPSLTSLLVAIIETGLICACGAYVFWKHQDQFILNL
ncbi:ABC transporter permease [Lachnospiraceae bacterium LCP25S3_G4]